MNRPILNFCTLFDSAYLSRGLALYQSLTENSPSFHLYILAMDDICATLLLEKALPHITVITLSDFETPDLLEVKKQRSRGEYCWTCTPFIIRHCLTRYSLDACTYLDADIYFFANPELLLNEIPANKSVLITEHRYTPEYDQTQAAGRFCVQFVCFKNTPTGNSILNNWAELCHEWCYARIEPGRFGDQKYQDIWPEKWPNDVHILEHIGGGVAPWNIQQYTLQESPELLINNGEKVEPLVFYHFHAMLFINNKHIHLGAYRMPESALRLVYWRYALKLIQIGETLPVPLPLGPLTQPKNIILRYLPLLKGKQATPKNILKVM